MMNYDELLSDFSTNENDVTRQKVSAEYYIKKQKKKTIRVNQLQDIIYIHLSVKEKIKLFVLIVL